MNVQGSTLFMKALGQQMALARGGIGATGGQRQALAHACMVESCDSTSPWGTWATGLGGLGTVAGNANAASFSYGFGGAAGGIDYRIDPGLLLGVAAGYAQGNQWANGFAGRGSSDAISAAAYGSFTAAGFYADALAGFAYANNQMQRQVVVPGLAPRMAYGSAGANQFLGQVESGYRISVTASFPAALTPFARLQAVSVRQAAFNEWGANSLDLSIAPQATNALRSTVGMDLSASVGLRDMRTLDLALRLGWQHEFADISRPITAAFAGASGNSFTVYGASPQRDAAVVGFSASTAVAHSTSLYLRYDGEIGSGNDNHALNIGLRVTW
jgi:outer membrane autotransporter protein